MCLPCSILFVCLSSKPSNTHEPPEDQHDSIKSATMHRYDPRCDLIAFDYNSILFCRFQALFVCVAGCICVFGASIARAHSSRRTPLIDAFGHQRGERGGVKNCLSLLMEGAPSVSTASLSLILLGCCFCVWFLGVLFLSLYLYVFFLCVHFLDHGVLH